jgi:hypothetical protein
VQTQFTGLGHDALAPPVVSASVDPRELAERYLAARSLALADWEQHGGELIAAADLTQRLGLKVSPLPSARAGLFMPGEYGYGAGIFLADGHASGEVTRVRRSPSSAAAEHDVIRIGWREIADAIIDAESVIKAIVLHKATGLPVLANNGIRGWANSRFHKARSPGNGTLREYVFYDSLLPDSPEYEPRRRDQLEAERLRCELSAEQGFVPYVVRLPPPPKVNGEVQWGVDDYAAHYGPDAVKKLLAKAIRFSPPPKRAEFDPDAARFPDLTTRPTPPEFIVSGVLPREVGVLSATGGTGKTTFLLDAAISIALGEPLAGHRVERPGPVVFVTGEDDANIFHHRLFALCDARGLTPEQRETVRQSVHVEDVSRTVSRFAEADAKGNLVPTDVVDRLIAAYSRIAPSLVICDPLIAFSPGERFVNDGGQMLIMQARKLMRGLDAAVLYVNHVSKTDAKDGRADQHAGRGGTAIGDGCRFEWQLAPAKKVPGLPPGSIAYDLHVHKLSHAARPEQPYRFIRADWSWTYVPPKSDAEAEGQRAAAAEKVRDGNVGKVVDYVRRLAKKNIPITVRVLQDDAEVIGVGRDRIPTLVEHAIASGDLIDCALPDGHEWKKGRRTRVLEAAPTKF